MVVGFASVRWHVLSILNQIVKFLIIFAFQGRVALRTDQIQLAIFERSAAPDCRIKSIHAGRVRIIPAGGRRKNRMRNILASLCFLLGIVSAASADDIQGILVDQNCVEDIVKNGREATLRQRPNCSLKEHYDRPTYALVTEDKRYYTFDETGNKKALQILKGTPNRDGAKVVVTGDVEGDTIKVKYMSIL